jgi:hypothetical protein
MAAAGCIAVEEDLAGLAGAHHPPALEVDEVAVYRGHRLAAQIADLDLRDRVRRVGLRLRGGL